MLLIPITLTVAIWCWFAFTPLPAAWGGDQSTPFVAFADRLFWCAFGTAALWLVYAGWLS